MWRGDYSAVPTVVVSEDEPQATERHWVERQASKRSTSLRHGHKDREDRRRERLNSELLIAVLQSDKDQVNRLLSDGANPEACCRSTMCSTVHLAALRGEETILRSLLEAGASTDSRDLEGRQAIHLACWAGYVNTLNILLEVNSDLLNSPVAKPCNYGWRNEQEDSWDHNHDEITTMLPAISTGSTPLHIACKLSKYQVVQYLLSANANVNIRDGQGLTPLDVAGEQGGGKSSTLAMGKQPNHMLLAFNDSKRSKQPRQSLYPTIDDLWSHGNYFRNRNFTGSSVASVNDNDDDRLEKRRPSSPLEPPNILRDERMSPISDSGEKSNKPLYDIVNALINKGARVTDITLDESEDFTESVGCKPSLCVTALHTAVLNEDIELIDFLLENGANLVVLNSQGESPLHLAVRRRLVEPLKTMLSWLELDLIDIKNSEGLTSLHQAVLQEWPSGVGLLLEAGADVRIFSDRTNETVIHMAAKLGNPKLLDELLTIESSSEVIDSIDKDGFTPLFRAIEKESVSNVEILIKYGANLETELPYQINVLHYSVQGKSIEILRKLLEVGPGCQRMINNLCDERKGGLGPLHMAAKKGKEHYVKLLLDHRADVNLLSTLEPNNSSTALHLAAQKGYSRTVQKILEHDIDTLQIKNSHNWTPLHIAACYGHGKCVVIMLKHGANIADTVSYHGVSKSALDLIVLNVPKPIDLLEDLLDSYICTDTCSVKYANCAIQLNYDILLGPTAADPTEDKQLIFLNTLLNNGNALLKERLMLHPLVESFLFFKWRNMRKFFIMLFIFYIIHTASLTTFSVLTFVHKIDMSRAWSCFLLISALVPIIITEILHTLPLKRYYFLDNESWIKWGVIVSSIITVTVDPTITATRHFASLSVLLSWTELLFLLARFPVWGLHVLMFEKVAANIFQVLTRFVFLFAGFLFAFMIHFEGATPFGNFWEAMCKVLVMVVELDYTATFGDDGEITPSSIMGRIMYVSFILLVAMAMTNLIVGMAVSDVAALENQSRTQRLVKQTAFLSFLELCVYNDFLLRVLPMKFQDVVKNFRAVPAHIVVHPNKSTETLPPELRANLLSKAMDIDTDDEAESMANQMVKLEMMETRINEISSQLNTVLMLLQAASGQNKAPPSLYSNPPA